MSTYLVAFANGHFEYLESSYTSPLSNKTRPLRIYGRYPFRRSCHSYYLRPSSPATKDIIHQAQVWHYGYRLEERVLSGSFYQFALDVKAKVLPIYEKVFDVEYPLPKLDTLVVSIDLNALYFIPCLRLHHRQATSMLVQWRIGYVVFP